MVSVSPASYAAITSANTLTLLKGRPEQKPTGQFAPTIQVSSRLSSIADLAAKLMDMRNPGAASTRKESLQAVQSERKAGTTSVAIGDANIPSQHKDWLRSMGADRVEVAQKPETSDAEFQSKVISFLKSDLANDADFQQALKAGTIKIQRTSDMPESGFASYDYTLYHGDELIGGAHTETINQEWYAQQVALGKSALGTVYGIDYFATWR